MFNTLKKAMYTFVEAIGEGLALHMKKLLHVTQREGNVSVHVLECCLSHTFTIALSLQHRTHEQFNRPSLKIF